MLKEVFKKKKMVVLVELKDEPDFGYEQPS